MKTFFKIVILTAFTFFSEIIYSQKDSINAEKISNYTDDVLSIKKRRFTYFVSNRYSDDSKFDVYKCLPYSNKANVILIRGKFEATDNSKIKKAKLSLYNASNSELVGVFNTNGYTGNYILVLVPNVRYILKIEVQGYGIFKELIEVPMKIDYEICQQEIKVRLNEQKKGSCNLLSFFSDENEKVTYIKAVTDTTKIISITDVDDNSNSKENKSGKQKKVASTIDELVKDQLEEERKKPLAALAAFKIKDFETALNLFGELLKNDPIEPFYNYYYGVSLVKLNKSRVKAIHSLQIASGYKDVPYDVFLYLANSCRLSYLFSEALAAFNEYKSKAKPAEITSNNVLQLVKNCESGLELMNAPVDIDILKRSPIVEGDVLLNYNPDLVNDKVKYKSDAFFSMLDKARKQKLLITQFKNKSYVHVGYSDKPSTNLDLFKNNLLPNGKMGATQSFTDANSPMDENYPYISNDGKTLFFSSKGHNSMGGYDIFKCTRQDTLSDWGKPINMGYPINSAYDDYFFIPDTSGKHASFITTRKNDKAELFYVRMPFSELTFSVLKGNFSTQDSVVNKDALISVFNNKTNELVGVYKTNPLTGNYLMILTAATKYDISVETPGYPELTTSFEIPGKRGEYTLKQLMKCVKEKSKKVIKLTNYFTQYEADRINLDAISTTTVPVKNETTVTTITKKVSRTAIENEKDKSDLELAQKLFEQSNYQEAAAMYGKLSPIINFTAEQHYEYGLSLYHTKRDKVDCLKELETAAKSKETNPNVFYYIGKSYYENYQFKEAIKNYKRFEGLVKAEELVNYSLEKEYTACNNGILLINNPSLIMEIYDKKHVDMNAIQNSITNLESGGKILVLTDDLRSSIDKKKNYKPLFFITSDKSTIYVSSYGDAETNSKDIYRLKKLSNGRWSTPMPIEAINTSLDEEFPCLSKDGKTLYFSSKAHDGMGGYDVYKSEWNEQAEVWGKPINMGAPVNSPFDDLYYLE